MKIRSATASGDTYRYQYHFARIEDPDGSLDGCSPRLSRDRHYRNQFHNELSTLCCLRQHRQVPEVLDHEAEAGLIIVRRIGGSGRSFPPERIGEVLELLAELHRSGDAADIAWRPVWHSAVSSRHLFSATTTLPAWLARRAPCILDALPILIDRMEHLPRAFTKADCVVGNVIFGGSGIHLIDFETVHHGIQATDVVELLWSIDQSVAPIAPRQWLRHFDQYASCLPDGVAGGIEAFLLLVIRKTFWSHRDAARAIDLRAVERMLFAFEALRELRLL